MIGNAPGDSVAGRYRGRRGRCVEHEPNATTALTVGVAGLAVAGEVVQRLVLVGELLVSSLSSNGPV